MAFELKYASRYNTPTKWEKATTNPSVRFLVAHPVRNMKQGLIGDFDRTYLLQDNKLFDFT